MLWLSPRLPRSFLLGSSSEDKSLRLYEGYYHELHNDLGRERAHWGSTGLAQRPMRCCRLILPITPSGHQQIIPFLASGPWAMGFSPIHLSSTGSEAS